jgi:hypothetical protein
MNALAARIINRGVESELAFERWATERGFTFRKIRGNARADYAMIAGGELVLVQVKSASNNNQYGYWRSMLRSSNGFSYLNKDPYAKTDFDHFFFYGDDEHMWHCPIDTVNFQSTMVHLGAALEQYRVYFGGGE